MEAEQTLLEFAKIYSGSAKKALSKSTVLYRARSCFSKEEKALIEADPSNQLLTSPYPSNQDGRFHKKGSYAAYFSDSKETACKEVKNDDTEWIIVGKFKTRFPIRILSLLPDDYSHPVFFPSENAIHALVQKLNKIALQPDNYSETKEFVDTLKRAGFISKNDHKYGIFTIRYQSVKSPRNTNYFMCGAIETDKLLDKNLNFVEENGEIHPTDYGALEYNGYEVFDKNSIPT